MTENSGDGTGEALQNYPVITDFFKAYARIDSSGDKKDREWQSISSDVELKKGET